MLSPTYPAISRASTSSIIDVVAFFPAKPNSNPSTKSSARFTREPYGSSAAGRTYIPSFTFPVLYLNL